MSITRLDDCHAAVLRTTRSSYAFAWNQPDMPLRHLHWGTPITDDDVRALTIIDPRVRFNSSTAARPRASAEEFPVWGGLRREEVALKLEMPDGVRSLELGVQDVRISGAGTQGAITVVLADTHYPVRVELGYRVDEAADAIVRSARIINAGAEPLTVEQAFSASWPVPARPNPTLLTLSGMYGAESRVTRNPFPPGHFVLESRSGIPGHDAQPFLAVDDAATETDGEIWSIAVAWSGSWKIAAQLADDGAVHLVGGVNDFDLRHRLAPGAVAELPEAVGVYTDQGLTGLTARWHSYQRTLLPRADEPRPVHYNSWEAAYFDVGYSQQLDLATVAADLGVELFVIDDGWFAARRTDNAGLGDWTPDPVKFAGDTMRQLSDEVHALGMQFGLWVEPEMVNEDSDLYRAHPDWVYQWPTRVRTVARHQLMIDFSRVDVQNWAIGTLDALVGDNRLDYLKWDMNRPLAEPNSVSVSDGGSVWIEHVRGLYRVWDELRSRHPRLWIESCASGGGRADLGAIARTHWVWPSDNTDPLERLEIQRGYSMVNLPMTMSSWVTDRPALSRRDTPLRFRFHVAMSGLLAIGGDIRVWPDADRDTARRYVALYKDIRSLVQFGRLFRLDSPDPGSTDTLAYVADDRSRAAVFVFARAVLHTSSRQLIRLRGLDGEANYRLTNTESGEVAEFSGSFLQGHGVLVPLVGHYDSTILLLDRL
jgi:alpha-galactosidase